MAIKYQCDRCGKEISRQSPVEYTIPVCGTLRNLKITAYYHKDTSEPLPNFDSFYPLSMLCGVCIINSLNDWLYNTTFNTKD